MCRRRLPLGSFNTDPDLQSGLSVAATIRDCPILADHDDHPDDHDKEGGLMIMKMNTLMNTMISEMMNTTRCCAQPV